MQPCVHATRLSVRHAVALVMVRTISSGWSESTQLHVRVQQMHAVYLNQNINLTLVISQEAVRSCLLTSDYPTARIDAMHAALPDTALSNQHERCLNELKLVWNCP